MRNSVKLIFVILFIAGFTFSLSHKSSKHPNAEAESRSPSSIEAKKIDEKPLKTEENEAQITAYHFERSVRADLKGQMAKTLMQLALHGTVFVTELSKTSDARLLSLQFELTQGSEKELHVSRLPFLVEIANDQTIRSMKTVSTPEKVDEDDLNVLKDFVAIYAYGSGRDTTGTYQFKLKKTGNRIEKSKVKYEASANSVPEIVLSKTLGEVETGTGVWLKGSGKEQTRMSGFGPKQTIVSVSSFKLERIDGKTPQTKVVLNDDLKETTLDLVSTAFLEARPWAELKKELAMIRQLSKSKRMSLFHDLTKLLKSDPKAVAEFKTFIESMAKEPGMMMFGIGVLATAGNEASQNALKEWYGGGYGQEHTILNAFSTADAQLTDSTRAFIENIAAHRETSPDLAQNAIFTLGASLKHTNDEEARKTLAGYYSGSQSEADRLSALDAMGNSGDAYFLPTLKQAISSGSADERERAVFGARFLPADSAAPILMAAYHDESQAVRQASLRALQYQDNLALHAPLIRECASAGENGCKSLLKRLGQ